MVYEQVTQTTSISSACRRNTERSTKSTEKILENCSLPILYGLSLCAPLPYELHICAPHDPQNGPLSLLGIRAIYNAQRDCFEKDRYHLKALYGPTVVSAVDLPPTDPDHCCVHAVEFLKRTACSFGTSWLIWAVMSESAICFAAA